MIAPAPRIMTLKDKWTLRENAMRDLARSAPKYQSSIAFDEFNKLKDYAYNTEDSPYAKMLREQAMARTSQGVDKASLDAQAQLGNVYSQLAMGGGLSSGARERLAGDVGAQALMARQNVRQAGDEAQREIGLNEAKAKLGAQEKVLSAIEADRRAQAQYDFDRWKQQVETEAAILKSQTERDVARANRSCLAEGTLVRLADGKAVPIETIKVGDILPSGRVYAVQVAEAPSIMYKYNGHIMTGGHAIPSPNGWTRASQYVGCVPIPRPAEVSLVYNLATEHHFIVLGDGTIVGDLHETDDPMATTDKESLEKMNEAIPICAIRA
jgi:hypothetical protein